jgi:DNA-binding transcriptional ArsR family regulator
MKTNERYIVIAPMGDHMDAIYVGLKELPTEKVILITPKKLSMEAERVKSELDRYHVPSHIVPITGTTDLEIWESTFKAVGNINPGKAEKRILVNVGTGDNMTRSAATTAAFASGLQAFTVSDEKVMMLPYMKFNYYKMIPDKKMEILKLLHTEEYFSSLEELGKKSQMSLPLISYHINGNLKSDGLKEMGLVETKIDRNRIEIGLSTLGRMVVGGYVGY